MPKHVQSKVKELVEITTPFYKLKEIARSGWIHKLHLNNAETVASHTLLMILLGLFFTSNRSYSSKKKLRLIEMILVHDLAEAVIGDLTPDSDQYTVKKDLENSAFKKIMDKVPSSKLKSELTSSWEELNSNSSASAKFVKIIDKLEMLIQANYYLNNRKGVTAKQLQPFKNSTALFLMNEFTSDKESGSNNSTSYQTDLDEIKEILAYLCK